MSTGMDTSAIRSGQSLAGDGYHNTPSLCRAAVWDLGPIAPRRHLVCPVRRWSPARSLGGWM